MESIILLAGDILAFILGLWLTLALRNLELPTQAVFIQHFVPFSLLFSVWILIFFIAGLYEKRSVLLEDKLPTTILNSQIVNTILAMAFFYFIPYFGITPKVILFLDLLISFIFVLIWRMYGTRLIHLRKKQTAFLIGEGAEMQELYREVNSKSGYNIRFVSLLDLSSFDTANLKGHIIEEITNTKSTIIVVDSQNPKIAPLLPEFYDLIFSQYVFVDMNKVYEDVFDRVPLSLLNHSWVLQNISSVTKKKYDFLKMLLDVFFAVVVSIFIVILYPLLWLAIKLEDRGAVFIKQKRTGQFNQEIEVRKIRTMSKNENGVWLGESENRTTKIGSFLRRTSIDELPQILSILRGQMSFIGPRSDMTGLSARLAEAIPYYHIRYVIKPGITGWAQIHQHYAPGNISPQTIEENKVRLAYDLYYIKNRSLLLDIKIALRTISILLTRLKV